MHAVILDSPFSIVSSVLFILSCHPFRRSGPRYGLAGNHTKARPSYTSSESGLCQNAINELNATHASHTCFLALGSSACRSIINYLVWLPIVMYLLLMLLCLCVATSGDNSGDFGLNECGCPEKCVCTETSFDCSAYKEILIVENLKTCTWNNIIKL